MNVFEMKNAPAEKDYLGCGKAWAAIHDGQVVALRYMSSFVFDYTVLPDWVNAVKSVYPYVNDHNSSIKNVGSLKLSKIKQSAVNAGYPAVGPRGGQIKPSEIARHARAIIQDAEEKQFTEYRSETKADLAKMGHVVSGMCSCWEFVTGA